ncbi:MAG: AbrB/MazE/SpoVT family DNA-binding domain-containing protein [Nitrososphaerales archaeon]
MTLVKVGRRGSMVIPSRERKKAKIKEGDRLEIRVEGEGFMTIKKIANLKDIQEKMAGRLPQWSKLEGKADKVLERETKSRSR